MKLVCSSNGPSGPLFTTNDFDGTTNSIGTEVTFTCLSDGTTTFTSQCQANGYWEPIIGTCPSSGF